MPARRPFARQTARLLGGLGLVAVLAGCEAQPTRFTRGEFDAWMRGLPVTSTATPDGGSSLVAVEQSANHRVSYLARFNAQGLCEDAKLDLNAPAPTDRTGKVLPPRASTAATPLSLKFVEAIKRCHG